MIRLNHNQNRNFSIALQEIPKDSEEIILQQLEVSRILWIMHPKIHVSIDYWGDIAILKDTRNEDS